jgi:hypothetical protein
LRILTPAAFVEIERVFGAELPPSARSMIEHACQLCLENTDRQRQATLTGPEMRKIFSGMVENAHQIRGDAERLEKALASTTQRGGGAISEVLLRAMSVEYDAALQARKDERIQMREARFALSANDVSDQTVGRTVEERILDFSVLKDALEKYAKLIETALRLLNDEMGISGRRAELTLPFIRDMAVIYEAIGRKPTVSYNDTSGKFGGPFIRFVCETAKRASLFDDETFDVLPTRIDYWHKNRVKIDKRTPHSWRVRGAKPAFKPSAARHRAKTTPKK